MDKQRGFGVVIIILLVFGVLVGASAGAAVMALTGKAPQCETSQTQARSEKEIGDALETGSVTITDGEATTLAQSYIGDKVDDARVCFTQDLGHISGKIKLGQFNPSFYVSSGADLTGQKPVLTNLGIQLGSVPNIPVISSLAQGAINKLLTENLDKFELNQKYSAGFTKGSVTIQKL